jgi:hypothetical protein
LLHDSFLKQFRETKSPFITNPYRFGGSAVGGWKELARHTLESIGQLDISSIPDKRYYMVLFHKPSGNSSYGLRFNNDSGTNYAGRRRQNGVEYTRLSRTAMPQTDFYVTTNGNSFGVNYIANLAGKEKLVIGHVVDTTAGAGTAPDRDITMGKWANTSSVINRIAHNGTAHASDSEMVVLGWDPVDDNTGGFWEELASVELESPTDIIDSGTFTAKKYLWFQVYTKPSGNQQITLRLNSDSGSNYARRQATNGGGENTPVNLTQVKAGAGSVTTSQFGNFFMINNSAHEKLGIGHTMVRETAGAGTTPTRAKIVFKWANTSTQVTSIQVDNDQSGNYDTGSILKVWGSD